MDTCSNTTKLLSELLNIVINQNIQLNNNITTINYELQYMRDKLDYIHEFGTYDLGLNRIDDKKNRDVAGIIALIIICGILVMPISACIIVFCTNLYKFIVFCVNYIKHTYSQLIEHNYNYNIQLNPIDANENI